MIRSIAIRNFRSFREARIEGCRRVNVIVGDNGSGKTGFLEGLFLAAGASPEVFLRTRAWRGYEAQQYNSTPEDVNEALWGDLFYQFETHKPAHISLTGDLSEQNRSLTINFYPPGALKLLPSAKTRPDRRPEIVQPNYAIDFKYQIRGSGSLTVYPTLDKDGLRFSRVPESYIRASFFAANQTASGHEAARYFSNLSKSFRENEFLFPFQKVFPNVRGVSVDLSAGMPMLFASIDGLDRKVPISLVSGGTNKLAAILLGMVEQKDGIVIIDEIENGFFHERLLTVWESILEFSRKYNCQVFASSHSAECLKAVASLASTNPEEFCLLRAVHRERDTTIRYFSGERFASAIAGNVEVR